MSVNRYGFPQETFALIGDYLSLDDQYRFARSRSKDLEMMPFRDMGREETRWMATVQRLNIGLFISRNQVQPLYKRVFFFVQTTVVQYFALFPPTPCMNPALKDGECTSEGFPPLSNSEVNYPSPKDRVSGTRIKMDSTPLASQPKTVLIDGRLSRYRKGYEFKQYLIIRKMLLTTTTITERLFLNPDVFSCKRSLSPLSRLAMDGRVQWPLAQTSRLKAGELFMHAISQKRSDWIALILKERGHPPSLEFIVAGIIEALDRSRLGLEVNFTPEARRARIESLQGMLSAVFDSAHWQTFPLEERLEIIRRITDRPAGQSFSMKLFCSAYLAVQAGAPVPTVVLQQSSEETLAAKK